MADQVEQQNRKRDLCQCKGGGKLLSEGAIKKKFKTQYTGKKPTDRQRDSPTAGEKKRVGGAMTCGSGKQLAVTAAITHERKNRNKTYLAAHHSLKNDESKGGV